MKNYLILPINNDKESIANMIADILKMIRILTS